MIASGTQQKVRAVASAKFRLGELVENSSDLGPREQMIITTVYRTGWLGLLGEWRYNGTIVGVEGGKVVLLTYATNVSERYLHPIMNIRK